MHRHGARKVSAMAKHSEVFEMRQIGSIFAKNDRNFRRTTNYRTNPKSSLYQDMLENGFRVDKPLVTSVQEDGRDLVLQGHRRFDVALKLHAIDPERFAKLPCLRLFGLTADEEIVKMADQFHVESLDPHENYLAIKALYRAGKSMAEIERITGHKHGYVQRRIWVIRAPSIVEEEWIKKVDGTDGAVNLTDVNLNKIMMSFNANLEENPKAKEGGPKFKEAWANLVSHGDPEGKAPAPRAKSRERLLELASAIKDEYISEALRFAAGEPNISPGDLADAVMALRVKATKWDEYSASLDTKKGNGKKTG